MASFEQPTRDYPEFALDPEEEFGADPSLVEPGLIAEQDVPGIGSAYSDREPLEDFEELDEQGYGYSQQYQQYSIPEHVKQFISYLQRYIRDKDVSEIQNMYESNFNKLSEKYFKGAPWPHYQYVSTLVNNDPVFMLLYKELYFRHIYSKMIPTLEQRFESWKNYSDLFSFLLANSSPELDLHLPNQWLWDMIDEFIYQFQSFCQYRSKLKSKGSEELAILKNNTQVWNTNSVLNYLQSLVTKSRIVQFLEREKLGLSTSSSENPDLAFANHPLYKMVGYFSLVGLLRVQCLLGDYYLGLKTVAPIQLNTRGLLTKVTSCHITFFYYSGFVYMMMRRYVDAIKTFANILLYISRTKQYHTRSYQFEQILKKNEQMYSMLAICISLCPQRVDENIHSVLREKYADKMQKMQKGDEETFDELFVYACPKFINPAAPNYGLILEDPVKNPPQNFNQEPLQLQRKLFLSEVKQQALLSTIRSYLKLYTTIGTKKLSAFLELDEKTFRTHLLCYKHKTRALQWSSGSAISGDWASSSDVDFFVDQDMVHIRDAKVQRKYSEFFIRHINKFESIIKELSDKI